MNSQPDLNIDCKSESNAIEEKLKTLVYDYLKRDGAVVGLSGGVDSAVTAALCVRALGKEKVLLVSLPEKESNPLGTVLAERFARELETDLIKQDITPLLDALGVYSKLKDVITKYYPSFNETCRYKITLPQDIMTRARLNLYSLVIEDEKGDEIFKKRLSIEDYRDFRAAISMKLRTRMTCLYYFAEKHGRAVAGTTNKTEFALGNFCKYGDGGVDLETISHLYKTQVYEMAKYLNVPEEIRKRVPSPDICSAEVSDSEFFFSLPLETADRLLYCYHNEISTRETAAMLALEEEQSRRIFEDFANKIRNTRHLKELPPACGQLDN